jgi:hypothetical protein
VYISHKTLLKYLYILHGLVSKLNATILKKNRKGGEGGGEEEEEGGGNCMQKLYYC